MKVLVVGTGSIGRRHTANLQALGADVSTYSYGGIRLKGVKSVMDLDLALQSDFDAVVVANNTNEHMDVSMKAALKGKHLFIEKPLATNLKGSEFLYEIAQRMGLVVEVGFMLRTHPNLIWIKQALADGVLGDLMYIYAAVGQWLPDWRPNSDYRTSYSAYRARGGGVIYDLIHELDLVYWLAGEVSEVSAMSRYVKSLAIETEAIAQIGLRFKTGVLAQVHLDYVRPGYGRKLEIVGSNGVLSWDYLTNKVFFTRGADPEEIVHSVEEGYERNIMFKTHMGLFLDRINKKSLDAISPLNDSIEVLKIALACHKSAEKHCWVLPSEISNSFEPKMMDN